MEGEILKDLYLIIETGYEGIESLHGLVRVLKPRSKRRVWNSCLSAGA